MQKDLGTVSSEIETLQDRSHNINAQLSRRRVIENLLGPTLEDTAIPPAIVVKLSEGDVDQDWIVALAVLDRQIASSNSVATSKESLFQHSEMVCWVLRSVVWTPLTLPASSSREPPEDGDYSFKHARNPAQFE